MAVPALQRCVGDVDRFFELHWARSPLLLPPDAPGSFDDLASLDDLDRMVSSLGLTAANLRMVRAGKTLAPSEYTSTGRSKRSADPLVSPASVYRRYEEGATIVLESLHRYWSPLTDFCRDLELSLGHRLQVNAYITPPSSHGFDVHRDDHDVFVLQVSGSKHWIVYDTDEPDSVAIDEVLSKGSCLYIPRGFPHAAATTDAASAHLTVGVLTHDSIDIVREVVDLAKQQPAFKDRLDIRGVRDAKGLKELVERELDELRVWIDKLDVDDVTERVARRVFSTAQPIERGTLTQLEKVGGLQPSDEVRRRPGSTCVLFPRDTSLKVLLADRELEMPLAALPAMQAIAREQTFRIGDLHDKIDAESALVLVRRLIKEGLLEVVVDR